MNLIEHNSQNSSQIVSDSSPTKVKPFLVVFFLFLLVIGTSYYYFIREADQKNDFVIENFPSATIYNHVGQNSYIANSSIAAIKSVLDYYGENITDDTLNRISSELYNSNDPTRQFDLRSVEKVANDFGYRTEIITTTEIDGLSKYINARDKLPLIFEKPIQFSSYSDYTPEVKIDSFGVVVGVSETTNEITFTDFHYGPKMKVGIPVMNDSWNIENNEYKNKFLVIYPKNESYKLGDTSVDIFTRSESLDKAAPLVVKMMLVEFAFRQKQYDLYQRLADEVLRDPDFEEYLPPYFKLLAYSHAAGIKLFFADSPDLEVADKYVSKMEDLNGNLDQPFGDFWLGYEDKNVINDKVSYSPYYLRGVINRMSGNLEEAMDSLGQADILRPYGTRIVNEMELVRSLMESQ